MKKTRLILMLVAIIYSFTLQARKIVVSTTATLQTAFNGAQSGDTIILKPGTYNVGTALKIPATGAFVLKSAIKDSMAIIQMEMQATANVSDNAFPQKPSLIFENLHLQSRYGTYDANNGYIISLSGRYFSIDTLAFRNCEISKASRCLFRSGAPTDSLSSGYMEWFEMTNCLVHEMNSSANIWPIVYSAHVPMYVYFRNNTFYDIPCAKSIFQLNKMTSLTGRNAEIYFENNIVINTWARADGIITTSNYLGEEALYNINNNMFILPNWSDKYNMRKDSSLYIVPPILKCVGGIITAKNNIVDSCKYWLQGQILDAEGQGGFLVIDTANTYRLRNLNFSISDFADAQGNDFSYLSTKQPATAGNKGGPIGDPRWVKTFATPRTLITSANTALATVTPKRAYYEDGATVKVTASVVDGYKFNGWKKVSDGSLLSTANPYSFAINADMEIQADYAVLVERKVSITISGSNSATYKVTPQKAIYYEGDEITISLNTHSINTFMGWSDANNDLTRSITLSGGDLTLTANFTEHPYYLCWDFDQLTANNQTFKNLAANHKANALNPGIMNYVMLDTVRTISTRNIKFTTPGKELIYCLARRTHINNFSNPDYVYIKFSTKGLSNLKVKSLYSTDNSTFKVQKLQYSVNGGSYSTFATDTITATDTISGGLNQTWMPFEGTLPVDAENQDTISVRWIADATSERLFIRGLTASDYEYSYISRIIVIDKSFTTSSKHLDTKPTCKIYAVADRVMVQTEVKGIAEVYTLMGQKIKSKALNNGLNEVSGLKSGIYLVRVGSQVQKVYIE